MTHDRPSHIERLQSAVLSRNLSSEPGSRSDADYLAAAGVVSRRTGVDASMHLRTTSSASDLRRAREAVAGITCKLNAARRWGLSAEGISHVAEAALVYHLEPACRHCNGRGYRLITGAPVKSDKQCTHCRGTGRHPIPRKHREQIDAVLLVLRDSDTRVERRIAALMR